MVAEQQLYGTNPVNTPTPTRILSGSAGKHWPEAGRMILAHRLASGPDPFGQNLTQSARTKSDEGLFCTALSGTSVEERNRVWNWETGSGLIASCQKPGQMTAHRLAFRPDAFGQTLTRPSRSDPGQFYTILSMPSLTKNGAETDAGSRIVHNILFSPILAARWS